MSVDPLQHEAAIRLGSFLGVAGLLLVLQWRFAIRGDGTLARRQAVNGREYDKEIADRADGGT